MSGSSAWTVVSVAHHEDGSTTLTMRNERGNIRTEDFPPGSTVHRIVENTP